MWWKILVGFFVLRSVSQAAAPVNKPSGVMPMTFTGNFQPPPNLQGEAMYTPGGGPTPNPAPQTGFKMMPPVVSPMFDNNGPQKIMQAAPMFGGSAGFEF